MQLGFSGTGWCSGPNYSGKKATFLFFINSLCPSTFILAVAYATITDRLVDTQALRKAFEAFYTTILPKGGHPFVYFSLQVAPHKIDVNVHPTKHEVFFEDEEDITGRVIEQVSSALSDQAISRRFASSQVQSKHVTEVPTPTTLSYGGRRKDGSRSRTQKTDSVYSGHHSASVPTDVKPQRCSSEGHPHRLDGKDVGWNVWLCGNTAICRNVH